MKPDLTTRYLGLELRNPVVASASPLTGELDSLRAIEEAGAAAVVLPSLFEEQIVHEQTELHAALEQGAESFGEALSYFPELDDYNTGPDAYLEHLAAAKEALEIPVVASLNGFTPGGWVRFAEDIQQAGADALELNVYSIETDRYASAASVEDRTLRLVYQVHSAVSIPVAVKVSPYYTSLPNMAARLADANVHGIVLFNRFVQPDIDLETLTVVPRLHLSSREELTLPLRWIAILRGHLPVSLAASTGVQEPEDVLKLLLAGADVVMVTSHVLRRGPGLIGELLEGVEAWMTEREYASVEQLRGSLSQEAVGDPKAFERVHYMRALTSYATGQRERALPQAE